MPKIGKDVVGKRKDKGILRTKKERELYEEAKRRKAEEEEEERKKQKKKRHVIKTRLPEDKEPTPEQLAQQEADVLGEMRRLKVKKVVLKEEEE